MKRVLVTAGQSNLGKAIRAKFEKEGYEVWYTVSQKSKVDSPKAISVDLRNEKEVKEALSSFIDLDVLVNNAGVFTEGKQDKLDLDSFEEVFSLNVKGLFLVTRELLPLLKKKNGSIVNVSSMNALHPGFGSTSHYDASKGAVSAYTRSLAQETGLRVNAVAPGLIEREALKKSPLEEYWLSHSVKKAMMQGDEIADTIYFLATSSGIYGQTILVDNGFTLL